MPNTNELLELIQDSLDLLVDRDTVKRQKHTGTTGAIATTLKPGKAFQLVSVALKINTAGTTAESFTVTKDAGQGAAYDQLLDTQATNSPAITDLLLPYGDGYEFEENDEIDCAWANTENRTYSVIYTWKEL